MILGWFQIGVVIYLTLTPTPPEVMQFPYGDKISHLLTYTILMLWFCQIYGRLGARLLLALGFIVMGVTLEFLQGMGGVRMFEVADMAANAIGVVLGWMLASIGFSHLLSGFEYKFLIKQNGRQNV